MEHLADAPIANILILAGVIFLAVGIFGRVGGFIGSIFGNIEAGKNSRVLAGALGLFLIVVGAWRHQDSHKPATNPSTTVSVPNPSPAGTATPPVTNDAPRGASEVKSASNPSQTAPIPNAAPAGLAAPPVARDVPREGPKATSPLPQPSTREKKALAPVEPIESEHVSGADSPATSNPPPSKSDPLVGTWLNLTPRADSIKKLEVAEVGRGLSAHIWHACAPSDCDLGTHKLDVSSGTPTYEFTASNRRRVGYLTLQTPVALHLRVDSFEPGTQHHWRNNWVLTKSSMSDAFKSAFARYFDQPGEKAFAMAPGIWSYVSRQNSIEDAKKKALQGCEKRTTRRCVIVLVNNDAAE
jgi:hypothetical protein